MPLYCAKHGQYDSMLKLPECPKCTDEKIAAQRQRGDKWKKLYEIAYEQCEEYEERLARLKKECERQLSRSASNGRPAFERLLRIITEDYDGT